MAGSKNQVTLTFAGDSDQLEKSFKNVGESADRMADDVGSASKQVGTETGEGFNKVGEAADDVDTKAMGFRDTITGLQDTFKGLTDDSLSLGDRLVTLGMGVGDLASGFVNFLIPSMASMTKATIRNTVQTVRQTAATAAQRVTMVATSVATKAAAAAQWLLNAAMRANPIGIVITVLTVLAGLFVLLWKRSETFRKIVTAAWNGIKAAAQSVGKWFTGTLLPWIQGVWNGIASGARRAWNLVKDYVINPVRVAANWVRDAFNKLIGFITGLPARVQRGASGMFDGVKNAFKSAVNWLIDRWNSLSFTLPSVDIPGVGSIGGQTISTPNIPRLHGGGVVPGSPGEEALALLQAGERVLPAGRAGGGNVIEIRSGGGRMDDFLLELLRRSIRVRGGDVQLVLGGRGAGR